ncbi:hypothetical protein FHW36_10650 [Chitinophaga polysaccharea]|uniref:Uncharacterized protein n=1 Tax=Chitinophaga polysaccharea TaxID=1293035 RepID=A0A561PL39_9BACT|nr:hypothetical protein [Chitinophaga polysaccharea]TWF38829.1 hypothetical protein FHW36_10650 [Chitinophaga polysaccharea]
MKKEFIAKLWTLWNTTNIFDDMEEFSAMAEALMAERNVRFENETTREWFYETINNSPKMPIREFIVAGTMALDFSQCLIHNVELG